MTAIAFAHWCSLPPPTQQATTPTHSWASLQTSVVDETWGEAVWPSDHRAVVADLRLLPLS